MKQDINFFKPYQTEKTERKSQNIYLYTLIGFTVLAIGATYAVNAIQLMSINREINSLTEELNAPDLQEQIRQSDVVFQILEILEQYDTAIVKLDENIISRDIISTQKLDFISSTIPSNVSFNSLSVTNTNIIIAAISKDRESIAEVQHNLKQLPFVDDVVISSIGGAEEFTFTLNCVLKEVG